MPERQRRRKRFQSSNLSQQENLNIMPDLFIEIGTEEIPAGYLATAMVALEERCGKTLQGARLGYSQVRCLGTPRRLSLLVSGLAVKQSEKRDEGKEE